LAGRDADTGQKHAQAAIEEARGIVGADHAGAPTPAADGEEGLWLRVCREVWQGALTSCRTANVIAISQKPLDVVHAHRGGTAALPCLGARIGGRARRLHGDDCSSTTVREREESCTE